MNTYFNGLFYVLCVVALVACSSTESTDADENTSTDTTEENQGTETTDTPDDTDTTGDTDTPDDTDTTDDTDTPDDTDTTDDTDTSDDTDTTDNTDTTDSEGFTCPEDDDLEDNDTNATATVTTPGSSWNAIACSIDGEYDHDNDVFVVNVAAGCTLYAEVLFANADGDLDMALTDATSGDLVGTGGQSEDDNEEMTYTPTESTDVYISIFPYMSMGNAYVLNVNMACP